MKIEIALKTGYSPAETEELGALADRYGIATVWGSNAADTRDQVVELSVMARATRTARLGIIAMSPFEMLPIRICNALLSLNELSNGRASILIGGGGTVTRMIGQPTRKVRAIQECIEILKKASPTEPLNYKGEIYAIRNYQPTWAVQTPPKVLAAANKPMMLRMAARVADGIMISDMPPVILPKILDTVRDDLKAQGRPEKGFELNNFWAWHVKKDKADALAEGSAHLALRGMLKRHYLEPFLTPSECDLVEASMPAFFEAFRHGVPTVEGVPQSVVHGLVEGLTLVSSLDELDRKIEDLKKFEQLGLTHLTLGIHDDPADAIKTIGERVVPAFS